MSCLYLERLERDGSQIKQCEFFLRPQVLGEDEVKNKCDIENGWKECKLCKKYEQDGKDLPVIQANVSLVSSKPNSSGPM